MNKLRHDQLPAKYEKGDRVSAKFYDGSWRRLVIIHKPLWINNRKAYVYTCVVDYSGEDGESIFDFDFEEDKLRTYDLNEEGEIIVDPIR